MRLEEPKQRGEKSRFARSCSQLVGPDSGQVDEPMRPTLAPKRCRERGEGENHRIIVVCARQRLQRVQRG